MIQAQVPNRGRNGWVTFWHRGAIDQGVIDDTWLGDVNHYDAIAQHITGRVVVDCGANIGMTVLKALDLGARRVIAIEPELENYKLLEQNCGSDPRVSLWWAAIGDPAQGKRVRLNDTGGSCWTVPASDDDPEAAPVVDFAGVIDQAMDRLGSTERIAMVKVDVEGGEFAWFDTATADKLRWVDRFAIEHHGVATHSAHLGPDDGRFGRLVTILSETHSLQMFGAPGVGGMIYAHHYRVDEPEYVEHD
jgi:FkbM family methyltransferase